MRIVFIFTVGFLLMMAGCRSGQDMIHVPVQTRTTVVERLVEVQTPADSSWLRAWFECDSNYNVLVKTISERKTAKMETSLLLDSNRLQYRVVRIKDKIFIPARDSVVIRDVPYPVEVVIEVNRLTGWQNAQVWAGRLFFGLLAAYLIFKTVLKYK